MADRWVFADDILRLEARALVKAASRAAHSQPVKDCRVLLLWDNLSVVLCFCRCLLYTSPSPRDRSLS
eukprot:4927616-Pyramimonas_sp.AAC.1